jgi:hypothetical protein
MDMLSVDQINAAGLADWRKPRVSVTDRFYPSVGQSLVVGAA